MSSENGSINGFRLSSHQRRLWMSEDPEALCTQCAILVRGHVDSNALKSAIQHIVEKHEILRTVFSPVPGMKVPVQVVNSQPSFLWKEESLDTASALDSVCARERQTKFQLDQGPNLRVLWLPFQEGSAFLVLTMPAA